MRQKGFVLIPIIIITLVGVLGFFVYQNTELKKKVAEVTETANPSNPPTETPKSNLPKTSPIIEPTTDWKTLNNTTYKFSLKYPDTLQAIGTGMGPTDETTSNEVVISNNPYDTKISSPTMYINIAPKSATVYKDISLADIVQEDYNANKANKNTVTKMIGGINKTLFAGEPAFTFQMESNGYSGKWQGFIGYTGINNILEAEHGGNHYVIVYTKDSTFDQILSTFKFTE